MKKRPRVTGGVLVALIISLGSSFSVTAQNTSGFVEPPGRVPVTTLSSDRISDNTAVTPSAVSSALAPYFDPVQGSSSNDLVRRALALNGELAAARIEIERARGRLRQAGLRPNPTLDLEQTTGRFTGSADERETSIGIAAPIELGGKRRRRIELAQAELEAVEAEVADRERRLTLEVRTNYAVLCGVWQTTPYAILSARPGFRIRRLPCLV